MKWGLNLMGYLDINNYYPTPNIDCTDDEILKELNMKAIAFSEHGNMFSWEKKMQYCKDNNI